MTNYAQSSMIDIALELLEKSDKALSFNELWTKVAELKNYDEVQKDTHISQFYTNLSLEGKIINVGENTWDLRDRHEFKEVHPDMNDYYDYEDEEESDFEEEVDDSTEEDDYN